MKSTLANTTSTTRARRPRNRATPMAAISEHQIQSPVALGWPALTLRGGGHQRRSLVHTGCDR